VKHQRSIKSIVNEANVIQCSAGNISPFLSTSRALTKDTERARDRKKKNEERKTPHIIEESKLEAKEVDLFYYRFPNCPSAIIVSLLSILISEAPKYYLIVRERRDWEMLLH